MKKAIILLLGLLCFPDMIYGKVYYVRPSGYGNSEGNGSSYSAAWDGFSKILWGGKGVHLGDTLYVCGSHSEILNINTSGRPGKVVTIRGDFTKKPGIISNVFIGIDIRRQRHVNVQNIIITNCKGGIYIGGASKNISIKECFIGHCTSYAVGTRGISDTDWAEDILIKSCVIANIAVYGDKMGEDISINKYSRKIKIKGCTLFGDGSKYGADGIKFNMPYGSGHLIEGNRIYAHGENAVDFMEMFESSGEEGRTVIRNNEFYGHKNVEIIIHANSKGIDIQNNKFREGNAGILIYRRVEAGMEGDIHIAKNEFRNLSSYAIADGGCEPKNAAPGNRVLENTFINNGRSDSHVAALMVGSPNWVIKKNIFHKNSIARFKAGKHAFQMRFTNIIGHTVDQNILHHPGGHINKKMYYWSGNPYTLSEMRSNTGQCRNDKE